LNVKGVTKFLGIVGFDMRNIKSIMRDLNRVEQLYNLCAKFHQTIIRQDLRDLRLFIDSLDIPSKTDDEVVHLFAKFDFLFMCRKSEKTKHISPLLILQYYDYRIFTDVERKILKRNTGN